MIKLPTPDREQTDSTAAERPVPDESPGWRAAVRKLLAAVVVGVLAYLVARNFGSREPLRSVESGPEDVRSDHAGPGAGGEAEADVRGEAGEETAVDEGFVGEERSDEEIEERGTEDAQETPAEPGEMNVEEDIVEDVVDEGGEAETGTEEGGETGSAEPEGGETGDEES